MNIIFSGFFHPLVGILSGFLLIIGSEYVGKFFLKKFIKTFFFLNLVTGIIAISLIIYIFIILGISKYTNLPVAYFLLSIGIYNLINFKYFNPYQKINFNIFYILFILLLLLILSVAPPTMADALGYHLGVANYINQAHSWPNPNMWLHANISGLGEVYNSLGLLLYSDVAGSLVQLVGLVSFLHYFSNIIKNKERLVFFNLFILSSPVLVFLVSGAKFLLLPQLMTTLVLYFIISNKVITANLFYIIIFLLCGAVSFKLSFFYPSFVLGFFALSKTDNKLKLIYKSILIGTIFFLPKILFNISNLDQLSFPEILVTVPEEFAFSLKNFKENYFVFPINLFLPESLGKISTVLGTNLFVFFLIKKLNRNNIQIFIIFLITSILYYFFSLSIGRMYYEMILWLSLFIIFKAEFKVDLKIVNLYLFTSSILVVAMLLFALFNLTPGLFNNKLRDVVMQNNANEYKAIKWINKNIEKDKIIITDLRSISLLNARAIPMDYLNYKIPSNKINGYIDFIRNSKIDYLILKNFSDKIFFMFDECNEIKRITSPKFTNERRNPYNRKSKYFVTVLKFDNKNNMNCIKNIK
jgi:hypothetical protein